MTVTKRTRYEVLKRDNHTCRYCGGTAPDVTLTVDHVTPVALGGSDDPSNLVAACRDCNAGKASTAPGAPLVDDVKALDLKWAGAIRRVAAARGRQRRKQDKYVSAFRARWDVFEDAKGRKPELAGNWDPSIRRFYELGVPIEDLLHCLDIAMGNGKIPHYDVFRYFAGCVWRVVTEMQDAAKALLEAEALDGS